MDELKLTDGDLALRVDPSRRNVRLLRRGKPLPWLISLSRAKVSVAPHGRPDSARRYPVRLDALAERRLGPGRVQWFGEVAGAGVALEAELVHGAVRFSITAIGTGDAQIVSAVWPGELLFAGPRREVCWSDAQQGSLFRSDGTPWTGSVAWDHAAMRVYGFTCGDETLAVIVETPLDAEATFADDGSDNLRSILEFQPSLGSLAYARSVRLVPLDGGGHVAVANAFREYARGHGLWRSWEERVEENPNVAKLKGGFIACAGYFRDEGADQVGALTQMKKMGFDRGYVFSPKLFKFGHGWDGIAEMNRMADVQLEQIHRLGYVTAPFLQVEEANESVGPHRFAVGADGERIKRWQINDQEFYEIAKWRVPNMLPQLDDGLRACSGIHFDTLTAMPLVEHWGARPYDRRGDARLRCEIARYYRRRGKVIGAESMRDWGTGVCDLQTSKRFAPVAEHDRRVWTIPLTDLVYHDAVIRSIWEHHAYDDGHSVRSAVGRQYHPFGQELTDLLTCSPPVLFPEGMLYQFQLIPVKNAEGEEDFRVDRAHATLYRKRFDDPRTRAALPRALRVCKLNEVHGTARMTGHRFLDADRPDVQETEFDSGLHVIVNFGAEPYTLPGGRDVPARGSRVEP
jgi:hypothetical protein